MVARWAPSGGDEQPWDFFTNRKLKLNERIFKLFIKASESTHRRRQDNDLDLKRTQRVLPVPDSCFFIAGCGRFGTQAARKLLDTLPGSKVVIVDQDKNSLRKVSSYPVEVITGESVHCLDQLLSQGRNFDYIVPAVPFHFVFEFIRLCI